MPAHPVDLSGLTVGDIRLTLIPDGYHRCEPLRTFTGSTAADWDAHPELLDDSGRVVMTIGSLLVELPTGERVLVDLAFGNRSLVLGDLAMDFWGGRLLRNLARVRLRPDDIDVVAFSHLHIDHIGWTLDATREHLCFPNARHVMARAEWDHWRGLGTPEAPSERIFAALEDRIELVDTETTLLPGLRAVPTPGHTPGHLSFLVESAGQRAVVLGDAIHCPLQLSHPEWEFSADVAPDSAVRSREHLLRELEAPDTVVVGPHFPDAVFGRVVTAAAPTQVLFDVAPPAPPQAVRPDAAPGTIWADPLDD